MITSIAEFSHSNFESWRDISYFKNNLLDLAVTSHGFQSGPVPNTFTRLRSCIVPAEITEPPKISGGQNHKYDRLVEYIS